MGFYSEGIPSKTPASTLVVFLVASYLLFVSTIILYRLYFSPLRQFPGPKFAAITTWYEAYFELFRGIGGQWTFEIQKLHRQYGPVVRIGPHEVHIHDPEYFDTLYAVGNAFDKPKDIQHRFGRPHASFSTPEHNLHHQRRSAISAYFSKQKIYQHAQSIHEQVGKLCARLDYEYARKGKILVLNDLFTCYAADVITNYSFNKSYHFLDEENFQSPFTLSLRGFKDFVHIFNQFPWLPRLIAMLPGTLIKTLQPSMATVVDFQEEMRTLIREARKNKESGNNKLEGTIFDGILSSNLPPQELSMERLKDEAVSLIGAGIASVEWTCTIACFYIANEPRIKLRLQQELKSHIADPQLLPSLAELEKLPFLMACVEESIRLSCGQMTRSPRISRGAPIRYKDWTIPPGWKVSMDTWHMHHDENIYPQSYTFIPERWLGNPRASNGKAPLKRYMTSFGKGTRICLGMNLAQAEIILVIAALFRRFDLELFETSYEDVRIVRDVVAPDASRESKGVRVRVDSMKEDAPY